MFWESISGYSVSQIKSLKNPDTPIPQERYDRYKRMARYWKTIHKVYLIDLQSYRGSLIKTYDKYNFTPRQRIEDIERRLNSLTLFLNSLSNGDWPKLLLIVPDKPQVWHLQPMTPSFTVTPHMEVQLYRGEGRNPHRGWLYYSPETDESLETAWNNAWNVALDYAKTRIDWPDELVNINLIHLFEKQCKQFNLHSIEIVAETLRNLKHNLLSHCNSQSYSRPPLVFLCHASEDKDAIVRRFHNFCKSKGINTWFDENEIRWGDRIIEKISYGLASSQFVVVFVSNTALKKHWVREELNAALSLGIQKERFVLPILLGITNNELIEHHPVLSARRCLSVPIYDPNIAVGDNELERLVDELKKIILQTD
jgi:hypothetical protein